MRVLLDEALPRRLKRELVGHDARTAPEMGWASKRNGELFALAAGQFEVFLTADRSLSRSHFAVASQRSGNSILPNQTKFRTHSDTDDRRLRRPIAVGLRAVIAER